MAEPFARLLALAKGGDLDALGRVFEGLRHYLLAVANTSVEPALATKEAASDLVQETFLDAQRNFPGFTGETEDALLRWMKDILAANVIDLRRAYRGTEKRDLDRERRMQDSARPIRLAGPDPTPSKQVSAREQAERLTRALSRLAEEHRTVIELRNRERLKFPEIAERMGRSPDAARMLWNRAVKLLKIELDRDAPG